MTSSASVGRPQGGTTTKCSFSLNTVVYDDLKYIADNLGVSRSVFLSMILAESLPALRKASELMKEKNEIDVNEVFISRSIIGSTFETKIKEEFFSNGKKMIKPLIKGSAFITGKQELYVSKNDPFPEGYRLNDTWPDF